MNMFDAWSIWLITLPMRRISVMAYLGGMRNLCRVLGLNVVVDNNIKRANFIFDLLIVES